MNFDEIEDVVSDNLIHFESREAIEQVERETILNIEECFDIDLLSFPNLEFRDKEELYVKYPKTMLHKSKGYHVDREEKLILLAIALFTVSMSAFTEKMSWFYGLAILILPILSLLPIWSSHLKIRKRKDSESLEVLSLMYKLIHSTKENGFHRVSEKVQTALTKGKQLLWVQEQLQDQLKEVKTALEVSELANNFQAIKTFTKEKEV